MVLVALPGYQVALSPFWLPTHHCLLVPHSRIRSSVHKAPEQFELMDPENHLKSSSLNRNSCAVSEATLHFLPHLITGSRGEPSGTEYGRTSAPNAHSAASIRSCVK